jgi:uncharacterized membrane protein
MRYNILNKLRFYKITIYHVINAFVGFLGIWLITGNLNYGLIFGIFELLYKPIQYKLHEKFWAPKLNELFDEKQTHSLPELPNVDKNKIIMSSPNLIKENKSSSKKILNYTSNR